MALSAQKVNWFQRDPDPGGSTIYAPDLVFRRSSRCAAGNCAEVATRSDGIIVVRSSEDPARVLTFTRTEWADLVAGIRAGEFD